LNPIRSHHILLKQAKLCLDNKRFDDRAKAQSLTIYPSMKSDMISDEAKAEERRRAFAKSKSTIVPINNSAELKYLSFFTFKILIFLCFERLDSSNKIIIHTSNSIATSNKLYDRRKLIMEELYKLKQARIHNHYV